MAICIHFDKRDSAACAWQEEREVAAFGTTGVARAARHICLGVAVCTTGSRCICSGIWLIGHQDVELTRNVTAPVPPDRVRDELYIRDGVYSTQIDLQKRVSLNCAAAVKLICVARAFLNAADVIDAITRRPKVAFGPMAFD